LHKKKRNLDLEIIYSYKVETMINRREIDYLCIKSTEIISKEIEKGLSEPYSEVIPREVIREIIRTPEVPYDATFKIILFGDPGVPKTDLIHKFLADLFDSDSKMTIGVDFDVKALEVDGQKVKLQIWDFGGDERFRFLLPLYVRGAQGGLFVYNITNYSSIEHIDKWLSVIRKEIKDEDRFPIIVVGVISDDEEGRAISAEEAIKIAESRGIDGYIECNLKTGENVDMAFEELTRLMIKESRIESLEKLVDIR